jgi:hypothetical protein
MTRKAHRSAVMVHSTNLRPGPGRLADPAVAVRPTVVARFDAAHPLAGVALDNCSSHRWPSPVETACATCWERAIRADERVVVEHELPREQDVDPEFVDVVAVERACSGVPVALTRAELSAAVARLRRQGVAGGEIAARLRVSLRLVDREFSRLRAAAAAVTDDRADRLGGEAA